LTKNKLHQIIIEALQQQLSTAQNAAMQAYNTATDDENVAENKYDTLGLEAAYLAAGQSTRVAAYEEDITIFKAFQATQLRESDSIDVGTLVSLVDDKDQGFCIYLSPVAGGLTLNTKGQEILLVTSQAPLGEALIGKYLGDEVSLTLQGKMKTYEIVEIS